MDVRVPQLGEHTEQGTVVSILVKEGDAVKEGQTLLELEIEKATAPIPSPVSGRVTKILVKEGDVVSVGQRLMSIAEEGAAVTAPEKEEAPRAVETPAASVTTPAPAQTVQPAGYVYQSKSGFPPPASPAIRKIAMQLGIDLTRVRGTEHGGRITMEDLKTHIQQLQQLAFQPREAAASAAPQKPAERVDFSKWGPVERKPMSTVRKVVAQKMTESWVTAPHVTQFDEADITELMALRKKYAKAYEEKGGRLTVSVFALKAIVSALKKYPKVNASIDDAINEIVFKQYYHVAVAVDTEHGLIAPVIRDAGKKSLLELSAELNQLAEKARQRKISIDELQGATFTLSNLGSLGGTHFSPIITKPQVAVLGLGKGSLKPAVMKDGKIETRLVLPVSLSYDHRLIDGADGVRFIREFITALETMKEDELKI